MLRASKLQLGLIALAGVLWLALASAGAQQQARVSRLGLLVWDRCLPANSSFGKALGELGHRWGQALQVVCRSGESDHGRLAAAARALAADNVAVIAGLTHITAFAAHRASQSIPIVMVASGDPVRSGLVASLARPGGNVTGLTYYAEELVEKRLQILKEIAPGMRRVAVLGNRQSDHVFGLYRADAGRAASVLGLDLVRADISEAGDLDTAFDAFAKAGAQGLIVLTDPLLSAQARRIAELAAKHGLPAIHWGRWFVDSGGLAAYSADYDAMFRRSAYYVDRILKGARPSELPVEQPTKFEFVLNLKAAKSLGLAISDSLWCVRIGLSKTRRLHDREIGGSRHPRDLERLRARPRG